MNYQKDQKADDEAEAPNVRTFGITYRRIKERKREYIQQEMFDNKLKIFLLLRNKFRYVSAFQGVPFPMVLELC